MSDIRELSEVRAEIDAIDSKIRNLLMERIADMEFGRFGRARRNFTREASAGILIPAKSFSDTSSQLS